MDMRESIKRIWRRNRGGRYSKESSRREPKHAEEAETTLALASSNIVPHSEQHTPTPPKERDELACTAAPENTLIVRDLWREAFEKLPTKTQQKINVKGTEPKPLNAQIRELLEVTKLKQEECEQKSWKFRVGHHEIVLRDCAAKIIGLLKNIRDIGDIAITFAPPQASIPWAAVKIVIEMAVFESAQMFALLASVEKIVRIINLGQVYECVYTTENTPRHALENLQSVLVELYGASMELLAESASLFSKNTAERTVHAIIHPGDTANLFSKLTDLETKLGHDVQACESGRSAATGAELMNLLKRLDAPLTRVDERVCTLLERVNKEEQIRILKWISGVPYRKHHNTVKEDRTPGTCEWLLQHQRFREWEDASASMILWLQGSPGTGKTFLTSKIVDHTQSLLKASPNHEGFAFFYCNRNEKERRDPLSVLQSYVRQLSTPARNPEDIRAKLRTLYDQTRLDGGSDLSFDVCKEQLLESVNLYPKTTLVLDALDECELSSRGKLINAVEFLLSKSKNILKVFISSRPDGDIRACFASRPNIEIQATDNQSDIEKFVNEEIDKPRQYGKISASLRKDIVQTLLDRSSGMFQWVYLQIKQVLELPTEKDIRKKLGKLPSGLKEAYDEIYGKIAKHEHAKALVDRACMWVMCACTPLSSEILLSAIRLGSDQDTDEITEPYLLALCNNLLVLDSQGDVWRFSHLSVTEYFEDYYWSLRQAHCYVATACLKLLIETYRKPDAASATDSLKKKGDSEPCGILDPKHPLQIYSRHHWMIHVQSQDEQDADPTLTDLLKGFLGSPTESSLQYRAWYHQISSEHLPSTSAFIKNRREDITPETVAILAMCRFSFYTSLLDWWTDVEIPLSQRNGRGQNLLVLATEAGCKSICKILIQRGMTVDDKFSDLHFGSALAAAAYWGHIEIVEFLVEKGANVNMLLQTGNYGSALAAAAYLGHIEIVEFLVEKGADVNILLQTGYYGSALATAAYWKHINIVEFLVEKGADVNILLQTGYYGSALAAAAAAYQGSIDIVKFLVEKGANVNILLQTGDYGSALAAAAYQESIDIVKFLVEKGADVNMLLQTGDYGSALATAVYWKHINIVEFLVEKGADVNMLLQTGYYGSALIAAVERGFITYTQFLLETGADVNQHVWVGRYGSALVAASYLGRREEVEALIEAGAEVNAKLEYGPFHTALQASQSDVSLEDRERVYRYRSDEEELKRKKAEVAEILREHGAAEL